MSSDRRPTLTTPDHVPLYLEEVLSVGPIESHVGVRYQTVVLSCTRELAQEERTLGATATSCPRCDGTGKGPSVRDATWLQPCAMCGGWRVVLIDRYGQLPDGTVVADPTERCLSCQEDRHGACLHGQGPEDQPCDCRCGCRETGGDA